MLKEDIDATPLSIGPQYDPDCIVRNFRSEEDFAWICITLRGGELFTDTKYWASLDDNLEWKRPKEICDRPIFVDRGPSRFDALQGDLGDCWFVAAMGALTLNCRLFKHVVPNNQGFDHNYVGAFHFRIWQLGIWYDVVVDDRLPVYKGQKKLYSVHSSSGNIFWAALLEKAYAKVNGTHEISYKSLKSGFTFTSMQDLSGGIIEEVETSKLSRGNMDVKSYLNENFFNKTMMCCGCHYNIDKDVGLYRYHAYAITSIYTPPERDPDSGGVFLVRIMNPWGHTEWKRDWADDDWNHWKTIDQNIRRKLQFVVRDDGEFWMNENDFIKHFKKIRICHLEPGQYLQSRYTGKILKNWNAISFFGEWVYGISAGGYELPTRHKNPQFRFSLEGCENRSTKGKQCNVVIELTYRSKLARLITFSMTFYVYSLQNITNPPMPLDQEFLKRNNPIIKNPPRTANHQRTYHTSLKLNPGMYCIIPCAKKEIYQAKFLLRIFSDSKVEGWEHDSRISRSLPMEEESLYEPSVEIMTLFNDVSQGKTEVDWIGLKNILDVGLNKKGSNRGVIGTLYTYIHDVLKKYLSHRSCDNCGNGDVVFTKDECRQMIAMLDYDHSGKISFPEFSNLWKKISFWAKVYEEHRDEAEGCITVGQVRDALSAIGYDINKRTVQSLSYAYANEKGNIELSDFILCGVVLETGLAYFQEQNTESGKSKFQSLDINNLYRASRGESLETHQHKSTSSRRHGMQSLGKVPSARRAPANLPSLKSEYSGNDPAVSLVPSGGTGWGSKPGETGPAPTSTAVPTSTTATVTSAPATTATVTVTAPPTTSTPTPTTTTSQQAHVGDKSWSSITSSGTENSPGYLAHQSPYFQQEFPSLSGDASQGKGDAQHLPGPSLRPQTEGSWMQGGSRPQGQMGAAAGSQPGTVPVPGPHLSQGLDVGGGRSSLGPSGVAAGPAGPMPPHHYRILPPFMLRHNHPAGGFPPNYQQHGPPRPRMPYPPDGARFMPPNRGPSNIDAEEMSRPIIKEEDLKVMDEIARDTGWAAHDEIDYNQTLAFSDEEGAQDDEKAKKSSQGEKKDDNRTAGKDMEKEEKVNRENSRDMMVDNREPPRAWQQPRPGDFRQGMAPAMMGFPPQPPARAPPHPGGRQGEEDEVWRERRRLQNEEIAIAVERAKQRKEEEEKRYEETRQAAARKLQMLEEKMRSKSGVDKDENRTSPSLNVQHGSNALLPDWEKDKDKSRSRTNSEDKDDKPPKEHVENFRNVQVDNRGNFSRDRERERDRDLRPDRDGGGGGNQPFSRQFQNNLPPRFQKHAAERPPSYYRQNSGGSPQPPYDTRWSMGPAQSHFGGPVGNVKNHRNRNDSDISDRDRDDNKENNRDRDRSGNEGSFDRERFNRPPSRDSRERSYENNWKNGGYHEEPNRRISESEPSHEYDNRQYEKCQETDEYNKDKDMRFYDDGREIDVKSNDNFKAPHLIQEDPFDDRENVYDNKSREEGQNERREMHKREEHRERERPQRPDSRDSRASRDSRNSRDSVREEKLIEETTGKDTSLSWADSTYDVDQKDDKRRKEIRDERDIRRDTHSISYHQRHIPGPITKEKLEASELKSDAGRSVNLVPLVRNEGKKPELRKSDNQWEGGNGGDVWQRLPPPPSTAPPPSSESWADMASPSHPPTTELPSDVGQGDLSESQQSKVEGDDGKVAAKTVSEREEIDVNRDNRSDGRQMGRGNRGMRHDTRGLRGWGGSSYYRGAAWRGADRGRRSQQRRPHMGHDWQRSESDDEVSASTESGKEDKRQDHDRKHYPRSPKQGNKKTEKDDRLRDSNRKIENEKDGYGMMNDNRRYDKKGMYDNHMERGFPPRGEPSRRGRGGAPFRSKGSSSNVGRRMDGYGPPTSKKPFTSDEDKKSEGSQALSKEEAMSKLSLDEKMKMNQQQLAAGIIGSSRLGNFNKSQSSNMPPRLRKKSEGDRRERKPREVRRGPVKSGSGSGGEVGDEAWETTSETSDHDDQDDNRDKSYGAARGRRHSQPNRGGRDRRSGSSYDRESRKSMVNGSMRGPGNKAMASKDPQDKLLDDKKLPRPEAKDKRNNLDRIDLCNTASVVVVDDQPEVTVEEDQTVFAPDNNGFQEVRSKKNVKEANRQQKDEPQKGSRERTKPKAQSPGPPAAPPSKGAYNERPRAGKLPPRFAKLRETSRLQKMVQQHQTHDINDLNKMNQGSVAVFPVKDLTSPAPPPPVNAWDKPITASLRTVTPPLAPAAPPPNPALQEPCNNEVNEHAQSTTSSQRSSPSGDKAVGKFPREPAEKAVLDGTSPPVQTIIFENTNFKSAPVDVAMKSKYTNQINKNQRTDKSRERRTDEENVGLGFKSPGPDMKLQDTKADPIQMPMSFSKNEDSADMKLDFRFDSDLTQLTDDKASKTIVAMQMNRSIQMSQSSAAELQFKLASVKKVWENPPAVLEHGGEEHPGGNVSTAASFTPTFGNSVEPGDPSVGDDGNEGVYNAGQQLQNNPNSYNGTAVQNMIKPDPSTNVCKVKPQPQATMHPHSGPMSPPTGAFTSSPAQPGQHINYQPAAQYGGISAIPSPPTVFTPQAELYPTFQINNPQVIGSQGRSTFSQFAPYLSQGLGQTSGFSQTSMYLQHTAPPPPPPSAAPPDMFPTQLSQYRIQPPAYGASQQLSNNPNTVLISSSTNSLMSASVKPSPQPIGAIGSKAGTYQTTSQPPPSQLYIYPDPQQLQLQSPFLQNSQLVQRPAPSIPPSSASYYSNNPITGGSAGYYQPGNSNMQAASVQNLHQTTFGMQAFNTQSPSPAGMGSFGSTLPRLILQNPGVPPPVGSRVPQGMHRSNSPAQPRTTSSPRINKMSHRQPSS